MMIRLANSSDSGDIFGWRNDPASRSMFLNTGEVALNDHQNWFDKSLLDINRTLFVGVLDGQKIGVCRFDFDPSNETVVISINLNPELRGKKLSAAFLEKAIQKYREKNKSLILALIKRTNIPSIKIFQKCGFVHSGVQGDFLVFELI